MYLLGMRLHYNKLSNQCRRHRRRLNVSSLS